MRRPCGCYGACETKIDLNAIRVSYEDFINAIEELKENTVGDTDKYYIYIQTYFKGIEDVKHCAV